jgi:hypothetical protein
LLVTNPTSATTVATNIIKIHSCTIRNPFYVFNV